jgi:outer membrane protein
MRRGCLALGALACSLVGPALAQERLDLPQAIAYAVSQNKDLVRARLAIDSGRLLSEQADNEFRPNFMPEFSSSVAGDGERMSRLAGRVTQRLTWGTELSASLGAVTASGDSGARGSVRLELQQPIFRNFGAEVANEPRLQALSGLAGARRSYESQKADLVLQVVQTYETILRLLQELAADREALQRHEALYRVTKAKEGLGRNTAVDTLRVELLRGQALVRIEAGEERLAAARRDFAVLLGFALERRFELVPGPALELELPAPAEAVNVALANRLDYAQAVQDYEDAVRAARLAGRRLMPDLRLTVSYDENPSTLTSSGTVPFGQPLWFVGISTPLDFNLGRERLAAERARVTQTSASEAIEALKLSIARQVMQQLQAYERAKTEVSIASQNVGLAASRAKLARTLFDLGRGDSFSVTDADVAFFQAQSQLFSARSESTIAAYRVARVVGKIVEAPEELKARRHRITP